MVARRVFEHHAFSADVVAPLQRQSFECRLAERRPVDQSGECRGQLQQRDVLHHAVVGPGREVRAHGQQFCRAGGVLQDFCRIARREHRVRTVAGPEANDHAGTGGDCMVVPEKTACAPGCSFQTRVAQDEVARGAQVAGIATGAEGLHQHVGTKQAVEGQCADTLVLPQFGRVDRRRDGVAVGGALVAVQRQPALGQHHGIAPWRQACAERPLCSQLCQRGLVGRAAQGLHGLRRRRRHTDMGVEKHGIQGPQDHGQAGQQHRQHSDAAQRSPGAASERRFRTH